MNDKVKERYILSFTLYQKNPPASSVAGARGPGALTAHTRKRVRARSSGWTASTQGLDWMAHERKESLPVSMLADRFGVGCPFTAMIFTNLAHGEVGGGEGRAHCRPRWDSPWRQNGSQPNDPLIVPRIPASLA